MTEAASSVIEPRKTSGLKKTVVLSLLFLSLFVAGLVYWSHSRATTHVFHRDEAPFAEKLYEPPSFIYGSSIHVWTFKGEDGFTEVAVTGHADSPTCRDMTGLVFNAYLQKHDEPTDLFVAGAARLTGRKVNFDSSKPALKGYADLLQKEKYDELILMAVEHLPTQGTDDQTAIEKARAEVEDDKKQLQVSESDPQVGEFAGSLKSRYALDEFVRETSNVAQDSGLVQVHTLPAALATDVRERIKKLAATTRPGVARFDDLLRKYQVPDAVVLVDVLRTRSGEPLTIRIPLNDLSADGFEEARKMNRSEVESSMVGDAERRRHFYQEKLDKFKDEQRSCKSGTPAELRATVTLGETCTADGICYPSSNPIIITKLEYCQKYVPANMATVDQWMKGVDLLLKDIKEDQARQGDSRVETMNHATLVDSMLRDWNLPVARAQEAFDYWRHKRRSPAWHDIDEALRRAGVNAEVMNGEQLVFSVRIIGNQLLIQPVQVIDLARSLVVSDSESGATRVLDTWSQRTPILLPEQDANEEHTKQAVSAALSAAHNGASGNSADSLMRALSVQPSVTFQTVEQEWSKLFRNDSAIRAQMAPKVKEISMKQERLSAIHNIFDSPETKQDDDKLLLQRLSENLQADPGLPVDLHMSLVTRIARDISEISEYLVRQGEQGEPMSEWQAIDAVLKNQGLQTPAIATSKPAGQNSDGLEAMFAKPLTPKSTASAPLWKPGLSSEHSPSMDLAKKATLAFKNYYELDPTNLLKTSLSIIQERDPQYLALALRTHSFPKEQSNEMKALLKEGEVQIVEWDAAELYGVQNQLIQRSHAIRGEELLWADNSVDPANVISELKKATQTDTHATNAYFQSSSNRLEGFAKTHKTLDTLARVEIAQTIAAGSMEILLRAEQRLKDPKTQYSAMLSDHPRLQARIEFEQNRYGQAFDTLFADSAPVSLYHPQLNWAPNTAVSGSVVSLTSACDHASVTVKALRDGQKFDVIRFDGLSPTEACALASEIQKRWIPSDFGRIYEQVLVTRVPLREDASKVRALLAEDKVRLALLKAMVFSPVPPANDLIPGASSGVIESHVSFVDGYRVPTLDELLQTTKVRYKIN